jgi:hypothetical protein
MRKEEIRSEGIVRKGKDGMIEQKKKRRKENRRRKRRKRGRRIN